LLMDPATVPKAQVFETLLLWKREMRKNLGTEEGQVRNVAWIIWWLSIAAVHIKSLQLQSKEMWQELARGFSYTEFKPEDWIMKFLQNNS